MTCRCYADVTFGDPRKDQICGTKRGDLVVPAGAYCCPGGCPGQTEGVEPRDPYGYGKMYNLRVFTRLSLFLFVTGVLLLMYLKVFRLS